MTFAWLLARGAAPLWLALLVVAALGVAASALLGRAMPLAADPVTNRAHDDPAASAAHGGTEPLEV